MEWPAAGSGRAGLWVTALGSGTRELCSLRRPPHLCSLCILILSEWDLLPLFPCPLATYFSLLTKLAISSSKGVIG